MKKENKIMIEKRIEELSKFDLELILLRLIECDKHINVANKTKAEIIKAHEEDLHGLWG
tara:strand:+ start:85 stop:261 length:177 start_codon:yes stop_codon:yes gene_type:complete